MQTPSFTKRWVQANTVAFAIGYLLYTPIAHGITGSHGRELTPSQLVTHCLALAVVGLLVFYFQRTVLRPNYEVTVTRIIVATLAFIGLFWFGYYQTIIPEGPDYDILFGFLPLGVGSWIGKGSFRSKPLAFAIAILSFPFASIIGELILFIIVMSIGLELDVQNPWIHSLFWLTVGITTGLLGGWISGKALTKLLKN